MRVHRLVLLVSAALCLQAAAPAATPTFRLAALEYSGHTPYSSSDQKMQVLYDGINTVLAAQADEVFMHPLGAVFLQGFGYYRAYFAEAAEALSIDINVFRTGEHKSYHDYLIRQDMSDAEKQEIRVVLDQLWRSYRDSVGAASRNAALGTEAGQPAGGPREHTRLRI